MVNWEFFDNQTPESATQLVDDLRAGDEVHSTRGPRRVHLARGRAGARRLPRRPAPTRARPPARPRWSGCEIARERGWTAPTSEQRTASERQADSAEGDTTADKRRRQPTRPSVAESETKVEDSGGRRVKPRGRPANRRDDEVTDTLTPVLTDNWDADRSWTLRGLRATRAATPRCTTALGDGAGRRHRGGQGLRPARPRRRGLPDRHEVGLHPAGQPASRTTSWSTPTSPSRAPARTSR